MLIQISAADLAVLNCGRNLSATIVPPTVQTGGSTGTPVVATPPAADVVTDWWYHAGLMVNMAGDWSSVPGIDYHSTKSLGVDGRSACIYIPKYGTYEYFLPYPKQNPAGPAANGVNYFIGDKKAIRIAFKPTEPMYPVVSFYRGQGTQDDQTEGNQINIELMKYLQAAFAVNQWNVAICPLADFDLIDSQWIYKFIFDYQGQAQAQDMFMDNIGFDYK